MRAVEVEEQGSKDEGAHRQNHENLARRASKLQRLVDEDAADSSGDEADDHALEPRNGASQCGATTLLGKQGHEVGHGEVAVAELDATCENLTPPAELPAELQVETAVQTKTRRNYYMFKSGQ